MTRLLLALAAVCAVAADAPANLTYTPPPPPTPPDPAGLVLRLIALTAAVLALSAGVLWLARRAQIGPSPDPAGRLAHGGTLPLGRGAAVHLIRVDGQTVAVTTDATGLRSMTLLSEPFAGTLEDTLSADILATPR